MDSNKDEANRCIEIGLTAMRLGNLDKAAKMLDKAQRLFPSKRAEDLLKDIQNNRKHSHETSSEDNQSQPRRRKGQDSATAPDGQSSSSAEPTYTPDQVTLVNKVLKCKDFYEVLSVCKESTDAEIKKAYKKLALKLHPDKNTAPGAVEAFKKVGNAVSILTDVEKRKRYDLYGPEEAVAQRSNRHSRQSNMYSDYYDYDSYYSAEDVFNMYFSGFQNPHAHNGRRGFRRQFDAEHHREGAGDHQQMTFGLILMIIIVLSMTSLFRSDPVYSLSPSSEYSVTRQTDSLHVPYYVKPSFETEYQGPLSRLELAVEEQYVGHMKQQCYRERHYRDMMMARARSFGNKAQFAQAQEMKTPSCDNLYRIGKYQY